MNREQGTGNSFYRGVMRKYQLVNGPLGVIGGVKTGNSGEGSVECDGWSYRVIFKDLLTSS